MTKQGQLTRDNLSHRESREFAFTRLMTCGLCGSGITAAERLKKLSTGEVACYVYYWCTRNRDKNCKSGCLREEELVRQPVSMIDQLEMDDTQIKKKFEDEMARLNKFRKSFLGGGAQEKAKDFDFRDYARYVLENGAMTERRELMGCIKSKIVTTKKVVKISN